MVAPYNGTEECKKSIIHTHVRIERASKEDDRDANQKDMKMSGKITANKYVIQFNVLVKFYLHGFLFFYFSTHPNPPFHSAFESFVFFSKFMDIRFVFITMLLHILFLLLSFSLFFFSASPFFYISILLPLFLC